MGSQQDEKRTAPVSISKEKCAEARSKSSKNVTYLPRKTFVNSPQQIISTHSSKLSRSWPHILKVPTDRQLFENPTSTKNSRKPQLGAQYHLFQHRTRRRKSLWHQKPFFIHWHFHNDQNYLFSLCMRLPRLYPSSSSSHTGNATSCLSSVGYLAGRTGTCKQSNFWNLRSKIICRMFGLQ